MIMPSTAASDQAIVEYEAALERTPQAVGIHRALGDLYREASRLEDAARHYELELRLAPGDVETNYRYGSVLLLLGRSEDALGHLRAAVDADPTNTEALFSLGKALFDQSDLGAAGKCFSRSPRESPHPAAGHVVALRDRPDPAKAGHAGSGSRAFDYVQEAAWSVDPRGSELISLHF